MHPCQVQTLSRHSSQRYRLNEKPVGSTAVVRNQQTSLWVRFDFFLFTLATGHSWIDRNARRPAFCSLDPRHQTRPTTPAPANTISSSRSSSRQSDDTRASRATRHRLGKRVSSLPPTGAATNCLTGTETEANTTATSRHVRPLSDRCGARDSSMAIKF